MPDLAPNPFNGAQIFHAFGESPVPEPAVLALVVAGILAMVLARARAGSSRGAALE